jgi:diaminohydroxyphosphoribosylaminopyrimidine deaminase / 5-amino-6-(5-phosphoribosylamino)uracil reductase
MEDYDAHRLLTDTITLAETGRGTVSPNPMVGAVVERNGRVVATGYHALYGGLHAEAAALDAAGELARGSTLYCNLEPCSYTAPGKHQPPCTRRIMEAGVKRVVIGQLDPNPHVRGRGVRQLQDAGIEVVLTEDNDEHWLFNDAFNTWMSLERPFVHLKGAMSLDGRIADAGGNSKWITDEAARTRVHLMRSERDAIAVGVETVIQDDPLLTTRHVDGRDPRPVVFDSRLRIPRSSTLVRQRGDDLIVFCSDSGHPPDARRELENAGVTVIPLPGSTDGRGLDLHAALHRLGALGITSLLVEGGPTLLTSFVRAGLFDRLSVFVAPLIIGEGPSIFGSIGITGIAEALRLDHVTWETIGSQQLLDGYHPAWLSSVRRSVPEPKEVACVHGNR